MRDTLQLVSIAVSLLTLCFIFRRKRKYGEGIIRDWIAIVVISLVTVVYYVAVLIDLHVVDIMNASDVSSTLRLFVQLVLMLYVYYQPRRNS
jgi:hypothetical protein